MSPAELFPAMIHQSSEGPEITWIGPNPLAPGLCLGFDDGSIILSDVVRNYTTAHQPISPAKEPINGVAAIGTRSLAVSTRSDVTFIEFESPTNHPPAVFAGGAHGVVATRSGYFIAPLGPTGLLLAKPTAGQRLMMHVTTGTEGLLYFYRMTALHDNASKETLIFANRRGGVGLSEFDPLGVKRIVHTMSFEGLDVIDVCSISSGSLSAVAISSIGEVLWMRDTSKRDDPLAMKLIGIEGQVYRVLATPQHLFVLSSKALYVWAHLVGKVLFNQSDPLQGLPLVLPMDAVDMSLYHDEYVLLVMAENAFMSLSIGDLVQASAGHGTATTLPAFSTEMSRRTKAEVFVARWQRHDVLQGVLAA